LAWVREDGGLEGECPDCAEERDKVKERKETTNLLSGCAVIIVCPIIGWFIGGAITDSLGGAIAGGIIGFFIGGALGNFFFDKNK